MYMLPGDLTITPTWNWHDHGNEGTKNVIWLDGLNIPLFKPWPVDFTEHYEEDFGVSTHPSKQIADEDASEMKFPWKKMQARLDSEVGDHAHLEYLLPNGNSISTTIGAYAYRIAAGKATDTQQNTVNHVFQVHARTGLTTIASANGTKTYSLKWGRGDAFVVPSWFKFSISADEGEAVYLFSFSDKPMLDKLGFFRCKA